MNRRERGDANLVAAAAGAAGLALVFLPVIRLRPNRIVSGVGIRLWELSPEYFGAWLIPCLFLILGSFVAPKRRAFPEWAHVSFLAAGVFGAAAAAFPALAALFLSAPLGSSRIALGSGFWIAAAAAFAMRKGIPPRQNKGSRAFSYLVPGLAILIAAVGGYDQLSIFKELSLRQSTFWSELGRHAAYAFFPSLMALAAAVPLAKFGSKTPLAERFFSFVANMAQVVPTLALIGLLIGPLAALGRAAPGLGIRGTGWAPASIALFLYALLPLLANARAGFAMIDPAVLDVAKGMGMKTGQIFLRVELPQAAGSIAAGFRTALAQNMGNAVLAGLVGGGGLGSLIFLGLAQSAPDLVLLGALAVAGSAYLADRSLGLAERGIRARTGGLGS
jgi:osmoprotectant transport system permease protein